MDFDKMLVAKAERMTRLGQCARARRLQRGLTPQGLASELGYRNVNRGGRRVRHFEETGEALRQLGKS